MKVSIKSPKEVDLMREAGKRLAEVLRELEHYVKPGLSTMEINHRGEELIRKLGSLLLPSRSRRQHEKNI